MQATRNQYAGARVAATARLRSRCLPRLGLEEGVGNKQPDAVITILFLWVGLGCVCSSPLDKQPSPATDWRAIHPPSAQLRAAIFPVLWLIGRPWPEEAAIHARPPRLFSSPTAVANAIGDAGSGEGDDGRGGGGVYRVAA